MLILTVQTKDFLWPGSRQGKNVYIWDGNIRMLSALFWETFIDCDRFPERQSILVTCLCICHKEYFTNAVKTPGQETALSLLFITSYLFE